MPSHPHPSDVELLGLEVAADGLSGRFEVRPGLVRHDEVLYGGAGLAVSVAAMEAATGRDVLWTSTQFVSQPALGACVEWAVEPLAVGKRAAQLLVRATAGGETAFVGIGSTGVAVPDGLTGQYLTMPAVSAPAASSAHLSAMPGSSPGPSWTDLADMRQAEVLDAAGPTVAFWTRLRDGGALTPAALGFLSDLVPLSVARAAGKMGAGSSLDNSMRFRGGAADTEWALLDLQGDFAHGGFGHGTVRVWAQDGTLLATGSQSASMRYLFAEGEAAIMPPPKVGSA